MHFKHFFHFKLIKFMLNYKPQSPYCSSYSNPYPPFIEYTIIKKTTCKNRNIKTVKLKNNHFSCNRFLIVSAISFVAFSLIGFCCFIFKYRATYGLIVEIFFISVSLIFWNFFFGVSSKEKCFDFIFLFKSILFGLFLSGIL